MILFFFLSQNIYCVTNCWNPYDELDAATFARLGLGVVPSQNPCLNLLYTIFRSLIRPVPVVFCLLALALQLYFLFRLAGQPHLPQVNFWRW